MEVTLLVRSLPYPVNEVDYYDCTNGRMGVLQNMSHAGRCCGAPPSCMGSYSIINFSDIQFAD